MVTANSRYRGFKTDVENDRYALLFDGVEVGHLDADGLTVNAEGEFNASSYATPELAFAAAATAAGKLVLPRGSFTLTAQLISLLSTAVSIEGAGMYQTTLLAPAGGLMGSQTEVIDLRAMNGVRISNLTIDCGSSGTVTNGIAIGSAASAVTDIEIDHVRVLRSISRCIDLRTDGRARINIHHCKLFPTTGSAINTADDAEFSWLSVTDNEIDGAGGEGNGISIDTEGGAGSSEVIISRNKVRNFATNVGLAGAGDGIAVAKISNAIITDNIVEECGLDGIHLEGASNGLTIVGNHVRACARAGISLSGGVLEHNNENILALNHVKDCGTIEGVTCFGINLSTSGNQETLSCRGNHVYGTGAANVTAYGIAVGGDHVDVEGNFIKNTLGDDPVALLLNACNHLTVRGNHLFDDQGSPTQTHGIELRGNVASIHITDNDFDGNVTAPIKVSAIGTSSDILYRDNIGYVTSASGAVSIADGGTITHGLAAAPTRVRVTPSVAGEMASVTALGATTFTVALKTHANGAGTTQTVYWQADV
jgi:hypothetical protein